MDPKQPIHPEENTDDDPLNSSEEAVPIDVFLKHNSEVFTIIGVFAAVSFYLIQFEEVAIERVEIGLVSSLVIFVIVGLVALNNIFDQISRSIDSGQSLLATTYIIIGICFFGLILSIYNALYSYAPTINPNIEAISAIGVGVFYLISITTEKTLGEFDGWFVFEWIGSYAHYLAALWILLAWSRAEQQGRAIFYTGESSVLQITITLVFTHFIITLVIVGVAVFAEKIRKWVVTIRHPWFDWGAFDR